MLLDTNLQTPEERLEYVKNLIAEREASCLELYDADGKYKAFTDAELEWIGNYLSYPLDKKERLENHITTQNRLVTINEHETSYEGLSAKFEAGDDAIEAIAQSRTPLKLNITPKKRPITQRDLDTVPGLKTVRESIAFWDQKRKTSTGRKAYIATRAWKDDSALQYVLRDSYYAPIGSSTTPNYIGRETSYDSEEWIEPDGSIHYKGFSLMDKDLCAVLLRYYLKFKGNSWGNFDDLWFMIMDFELYLFEALKDEPIFQTIVEDKWSGLSNDDIAKDLDKEFGVQ